MKASLQQATKEKPLSADEQAVLDPAAGQNGRRHEGGVKLEQNEGPICQAYREMFSQEEIDGLIAFYRTPVGQSLVSKQPELMKRTMTIMQQCLAPMMQRIQKMSEATALELQKAKAENPPGPKTN